MDVRELWFPNVQRTPMRSFPVARIFCCPGFPIARTIAALSLDARMFSQLHVLIIETSQNIL